MSGRSARRFCTTSETWPPGPSPHPAIQLDIWRPPRPRLFLCACSDETPAPTLFVKMLKLGPRGTFVAQRHPALKEPPYFPWNSRVDATCAWDPPAGSMLVNDERTPIFSPTSSVEAAFILFKLGRHTLVVSPFRRRSVRSSSDSVLICGRGAYPTTS